jgi:tripartite-type tricarboxylate transporter receptor subunit TctC
MKLSHRRQFLHLAAGAASVSAAARIARAETYPSRPVRLIVGYTAGGIVDVFARLIGQWLSERLGQQFVIENRPGAASNIAVEAVVKSPPDGYTLIMINSSNAFNASLYEKLNFNLITDLTPIASIYRDGIGVMVVNPLFPATTVPEFIAYAKANPGKINMASSGNGSAQHVYGELFKVMTGVDLAHVRYRGAPQALTDLIGGQVHVIFDPLANPIQQIRSGKLRALAVTGASRSVLLPDVPTVGEFVPGYEASGWQGIAAPKNTPAEIVARLNKEINAGLVDLGMKARFIDLGGYTAFASSPADFGKLIADYTEKWGKVIRAANIKAD